MEKHSDGAELAWEEMTLPHPVQHWVGKTAFIDGEEEEEDRGQACKATVSQEL